MEPSLTVNGRARAGSVGGEVTLLDWLRDGGLTGTKEGCAEGECGACAVVVARPDGDAHRWTAINACLVPAAALDGQEVVTAEGLGHARPGCTRSSGRWPIRGGSQCGYCTPGFVCSMAAEFYRPTRRRPDRADAAPSPTRRGAAAAHRRQRPIDPTAPARPDHEHGPNGFDLHALSGNLCRCTGYRPIRDAAYALGPGPPIRAARPDEPAPAPVATGITTPVGDFVRPADPGRGARPAGRAPGRASWSPARPTGAST